MRTAATPASASPRDAAVLPLPPVGPRAARLTADPAAATGRHRWFVMKRHGAPSALPGRLRPIRIDPAGTLGRRTGRCLCGRRTGPPVGARPRQERALRLRKTLSRVPVLDARSGRSRSADGRASTSIVRSGSSSRSTAIATCRGCSCSWPGGVSPSAPRVRGALRRDLRARSPQVSGARVVVDSSKHASLAFCLRRASRQRMRVAHVVRDSPAVVYSWTKVVARPEVPDEPGTADDVMARYTPLRRGACGGTPTT